MCSLACDPAAYLHQRDYCCESCYQGCSDGAVDQFPEQPQLTLRVDNRRKFSVEVVRIWVNDQSIDLESVIQGMSQKELEPLQVSSGPNSYSIKVATDRGNIFASDSGLITYKGNGEWDVGMLVINVLIYYEPGGVYDIEVRLGDESGTLSR